MTEPTTTGDWRLPPGAKDVISAMSLDLTPIDFVFDWSRVSMTADYLAGFFARGFGDSPDAYAPLSIVLNELLENAVKFSAEKRDPVGLLVAHLGDGVFVQLENLCKADQANRLQSSLQRVLTEDPEDLFLEQVERTALLDGEESGLGLIVLRKDHCEALGLRVWDGPRDGVQRVSIQAVLSVDEFAGEGADHAEG